MHAPSPDVAPAVRRRRALAGVVAVLALDAALLAAGVGGPRALLHHPRALALLAVWIAGSALLFALRGMATRDPVARRPDAPFTLAALLLVPLLAPMLSAMAERAGLYLLPGGAPLRWAGVALAAAGFGLRIAAMARLGARFSPALEVQRGHRLETGGVYARIRHPGYLGGWVANLGAILAFGSAATLPLALLLWLALEARMRREDALLESTFGEAFRAWRARTGRMLPRRLGA